MKNYIKIGYSLLIFAIATLLFSCEATDETVFFDVQYEKNANLKPIDSVEVQSVIGDFNIDTISLSINIDSIQEANNFSSGVVLSANISSLELSVVTPESGNFDKFSSFDIFAAHNDFSEESHVGSWSYEEEGATSVDIEIENSDLLKYVLQNSFLLFIKGSTSDTLSSKEFILDLDAKLDIRIEPLS